MHVSIKKYIYSVHVSINKYIYIYIYIYSVHVSINELRETAWHLHCQGQDTK